MPWDVVFAGAEDDEIELTGLAGGPEQNVFTGTTKADAVTALELYSDLNPGWRGAYELDERLFVALRWGSTGAGTTYILRADGIWQDIGLVVLKGDMGFTGGRGYQGKWTARVFRKSVTVLTDADKPVGGSISELGVITRAAELGDCFRHHRPRSGGRHLRVDL